MGRNTVDSLTTIRKLKEHKVECYFEKENIWTFDSKGELLLTIMSSLAQTEYQARYDGPAERFDRTKARLDEVGNAITEKQAKKEQIERFLAELERQDGMATEFNEEQWYSLVDFVTVFNKEDIRFTFKDGTEIKV